MGILGVARRATRSPIALHHAEVRAPADADDMAHQHGRTATLAPLVAEFGEEGSRGALVFTIITALACARTHVDTLRCRHAGAAGAGRLSTLAAWADGRGKARHGILVKLCGWPWRRSHPQARRGSRVPPLHDAQRRSRAPCNYPSGSCDAQQTERFSLDDTTADTAAEMEPGLASRRQRIRIAKHAQLHAIGDAVALREIAEHDR